MSSQRKERALGAACTKRTRFRHLILPPRAVSFLPTLASKKKTTPSIAYVAAADDDMRAVDGKQTKHRVLPTILRIRSGFFQKCILFDK